MAKVSKCCFCIDLETGGLIIAWLRIIMVLFAVINELHTINMCEKDPRCYPMSYSDSPFITVFFFIALFILIHVMLLVAIYKHNHLLVLPAIYYYFLQISAEIVLCAFVFCIFAFYAFDIVYLFILDIVLSVYFLFVFYSLYEKIRLEKESARYPNFV